MYLPPKDRLDQLYQEAETHQLGQQLKREHPPQTIWGIRGYPALFTSYSISVIGQWFDSIALMVLFAYIWQSSPIYLGLIPVALALPQVIFSQFVTSLVKRFQKIRLMVFADCLTACFTIGLFFSPTPWLALILLSLRSTANVVHFPIQQSLVRELVPEHLRLKAVSWNGLVSQGAKIIVPFLGGLFLTVLTPQTLLLLNAAAFLISAAILFSIQHLISPAFMTTLTAFSRTSFFEEWKSGWLALFTHPLLLSLVSLSLIGLFCIQFVDSQFPILFREIAPTNPQHLTLVISAIGFGAVTIITIFNRLKKLTHLLFWISTSLALIALSFIGFSQIQAHHPIILFLVIGFICGIGTGLSITTLNYAIQTIPRDEEVASIASISQSLTSLVVIVAPPTGAVLTQAVGVQTMFALSGIVLIICLSLPALLKGKKKRLSSKKKRINYDNSSL
ncbi:MFS transporter [Shouchella miscanthi]|uniref:MFS transporter n=1 Tax=Shouchella miscanthi TaxID=2598861 RepID=UPI0011A5C282|nr:MFS transporter [Shouchella miscanthi]